MAGYPSVETTQFIFSWMESFRIVSFNIAFPIKDGLGLGLYRLVRQKQLGLRPFKRVGDSLNKGAAHCNSTGGYTAEVTLGIACYLTQPLAPIYNKYRVLLFHNSPPKATGNNKV